MSGIEAEFSGTIGSFPLDVAFEAPGKGVTALFGPSGCGKTTILRCIAGLNRINSGKLVVNGQVWQDDKHFLPVHKRPIGYVFQEASLFAHLSVRENMRYGMKRSSKKGRLDFDHVTELLGLSKLIDRAPTYLSGGERQRVAIGRALLSSPDILLMDEPLAALDRFSKDEILPYLERLHDQLAIPMLYVSHDLAEIERLADFMVFMQAGKVQAVGPLTQLQSRLDLPFQSEDNAGVTLDVTITRRDEAWHLAEASFSGGTLWIKDYGIEVGQHLRLRVLASDVGISLNPPEDTSVQNILAGKVSAIAETGHPSQRLVKLQVGDASLLSRVTARAVDILALTPGASVFLQLKSVAVVR